MSKLKSSKGQQGTVKDCKRPQGTTLMTCQIPQGTTEGMNCLTKFLQTTGSSHKSVQSLVNIIFWLGWPYGVCWWCVMTTDTPPNRRQDATKLTPPASGTHHHAQ